MSAEELRYWFAVTLGVIIGLHIARVMADWLVA